MSKVPFEPSSADEGLAPASQYLESQLEIVLERDGVPISVAPPARPVRQKKLQLTVDDERDRVRVSAMHESVQAKRAKPVQVTFTPHEASRFVVRMDGAVAKPVEDVREPFHRSMHRWQTPMMEGIQLNSVYVRVVDLWIEVLEPSFFYNQFTPGDPEEAYRESQKGIWTQLRRPFIRWSDHRSEQRHQQYLERSEKGRASFEPQIQALVDHIASEPEETAINSFSSVPSAAIGADDEPFQIELMPDMEAAPIETPPERSSLRTRLSSWRERTHERVEDLHEQEQELVQEVISSWETPHLQPKIHVTRVLIGFMAMFCIVAVPAGAVSWTRSVSQSLFSAKQTASGLTASSATLTGNPQALSAAFVRVGSLANDIQQSHGLALQLAQAIPTTRETAETVQALLEAAQEAAQAGTLLSQGSARAMDGDGSTPDERLVRFSQYLQEAKPHLDRTFAAAKRLHPEAMPESMREQVQQIKDTLLGHEAFVDQADTLINIALALVGHNEQRTYLVLFQNDAERRPSGGFMGSYAELVLDRGMIHKLNVPGGGPYDLRSQLRERWVAPQPLQLVGARWEFQDANWSGDFAETADTVRTFWSKSGQPTLDGVIAVNSSVLPKLLQITGPIEMKKYGKTVTAENVILETQKAVELEYDRDNNTPKAFVGDLNREVLSRLQSLSNDQWVPFATVLAQALETKEIQIRLVRESEQAEIRQFGWTGEWPAVDGFDQMAVIGANIAGQKSDAVITESVTQEVTIGDTGVVQSQVTLHREHTAKPGELFYGANNVQYLRLYTPPASHLIDALGFTAPSSSLFEAPDAAMTWFPNMASTTEVVALHGQSIDTQRDEDGRSVVGGWIQLRPGMTKDTTVSYSLAKSTGDMARELTADITTDEQQVSDAYVVRLISQSGAERAHHLVIHYPSAWTVVTLSPELHVTTPGTIEGTVVALTRDELRYALFQRE